MDEKNTILRKSHFSEKRRWFSYYSIYRYLILANRSDLYIELICMYTEWYLHIRACSSIFLQCWMKRKLDMFQE